MLWHQAQGAWSRTFRCCNFSGDFSLSLQKCINFCFCLCCCRDDSRECLECRLQKCMKCFEEAFALFGMCIYCIVILLTQHRNWVLLDFFSLWSWCLLIFKLEMKLKKKSIFLFFPCRGLGKSKELWLTLPLIQQTFGFQILFFSFSLSSKLKDHNEK